MCMNSVLCDVLSRTFHDSESKKAHHSDLLLMSNSDRQHSSPNLSCAVMTIFQAQPGGKHNLASKVCLNHRQSQTCTISMGRLRILVYIYRSYVQRTGVQLACAFIPFLIGWNRPSFHSTIIIIVPAELGPVPTEFL